jgi:hypothetical protein
MTRRRGPSGLGPDDFAGAAQLVDHPFEDLVRETLEALGAPTDGARAFVALADGFRAPPAG